jgi:hypothetical protein
MEAVPLTVNTQLRTDLGVCPRAGFDRDRRGWVKLLK